MYKNKMILSPGAPCRSMFLSMFSQHGLIHFAANMYVLWSFTPTVTAMLGREQFLAMYLTAGRSNSSWQCT